MPQDPDARTLFESPSAEPLAATVSPGALEPSTWECMLFDGYGG